MHSNALQTSKFMTQTKPCSPITSKEERGLGLGVTTLPPGSFPAVLPLSPPPCLGGCGVVSGAAPGPRLDNRRLYRFSYSTDFQLDRAQGSRLGATGFRIASAVDINLVWRNPDNEDEQLLRIQVSL